MDKIYSLIKENEINIVLINLEGEGFYNSDLKVIFINESLSEEKQKEVILHELGHALNHKDLSILYDKPVFRSKMENEATSFMMDYLIKESDGHFDYSGVFENYNLGLGWETRIK
ncbi:ImmA/IrrE family metallo-endopeptidase [Desemzia sp. FAM 23989]|uniref:ImmA/IrrE family metallo-endopeptidase n=1 Tax=Desemzia sp. FAM 23989 TaxID=3259523 RepID=UPI00388AC734